MLKLLIGPALVGAGYAAGSYYGADAEQIVHKSPSISYQAFEQALGNMRTSGTTFFEGGTPVSYEIKVDRTLDQKLVARLYFGGKQGAEAEVDFVPENGGHDTLLRAQIHADRSVLRSVLAGTDRERLAYAPDWMLNLSFRPLLRQLADQIESGQTLQIEAGGDQTEAQWESNLSVEERDQVAQWRQEEATQPTVDPDAAARNYAGSENN